MKNPDTFPNSKSVKWGGMKAGESHLSEKWHDLDHGEPKFSEKWDGQHPSSGHMSEKWVDMEAGTEGSDKWCEMKQEKRHE